MTVPQSCNPYPSHYIVFHIPVPPHIYFKPWCHVVWLVGWLVGRYLGASVLEEPVASVFTVEGVLLYWNLSTRLLFTTIQKIIIFQLRVIST